ncbi:sulfatase-like hydrolase/transferase [Lentisphaera profundi]|uniref:Sulfatase-like hydrolase/transferase n=1 Tax=Lentisphaera profundi TaxID=1658616 RepID=A0ABY7VWS3_9BACT|nr:sulfatase-like hydrolase/transferase [Lentisphaera profundi]WDE98690.1 sulfatase-like hydrolase/transferase [Lentisphaera profundi]
MKKLFYLLIFTGAYLLSGASKPNIILILADDMGSGDVGYHGAEDAQTPAIDAIAKAGVWFRQGYAAASVCGPSRAGILTGRYQQLFGVVMNGDADKGIPLGQKNLAELLKPAGYKTAAFGKWHLGSKKGQFPNDRGFDFFYGFHFGAHDYYRADKKLNKKKKGYAPIYLNKKVVNYREGDYLTEKITENALTFIEQNKSEPFFMYVAYNSVHSPWQVPDSYLKRIPDSVPEYRRLFLAMVLAMDDGIGEIEAKLKDLGIADNTIIVFTTDNGSPKIGNKKANSGQFCMSKTNNFRGYKGDTYEGGIRVPMAIKWPKVLRASQQYDHPVIAHDLAPTFLSAAGIEYSDEQFTGVNLLPYISGEKKEIPHEQLFWHRHPGLEDFALRQGDWKLTWNDQEGTSKEFIKRAELKLFNLEQDPYEKNDLAKAMPEKVQALKKTYDQWHQTHLK